MTTSSEQVDELMRLVDVLSDAAAEAEVSLQTGSSMHKKHLKERALARSAVETFARAALERPAVEWLPLTDKLLAEISQEGARRYWLFIPAFFKATGEILVGEFEWRQGWHPDGFNTSCGGRESANSVTHVMLYTTPLAPKETP